MTARRDSLPGPLRAERSSEQGDMHVTVNGDVRAVASGTTVADVVERLTAGPHGVAVAVNREIVPRSAWDRRALTTGDEVEILGASQGG